MDGSETNWKTKNGEKLKQSAKAGTCPGVAPETRTCLASSDYTQNGQMAKNSTRDIPHTLTKPCQKGQTGTLAISVLRIENRPTLASTRGRFLSKTR
jgi:hypothetical protein